ncbi:hypothetical protein Nepgr_018961 [Nepenthes gracilis]|uniref:Uncharacterized protein n=1 Tax=Nepenthes gracilis TaxID=150966 RepID=A0AAD3SSF1_NEPGR|nr:hypothetical protein Nepgr_018961 [Nepenthes gracilis]
MSVAVGTLVEAKRHYNLTPVRRQVLHPSTPRPEAFRARYALSPVGAGPRSIVDGSESANRHWAGPTLGDDIDPNGLAKCLSELPTRVRGSVDLGWPGASTSHASEIGTISGCSAGHAPASC